MSVLRVAITIAVSLLIASTAGANGRAAVSPRVEVFALSTIPISNARDAQVYYLDGIAQLEAYLSDGLPALETEAQAVVQQRMRQLGSRLQQQAQQSAVGLGRAYELGVQRAPAVVFDGAYVVYGVTDVDNARRFYLELRR